MTNPFALVLVLFSLSADQKVDLQFSRPIRVGCERQHVQLYSVDRYPDVLPAEAGDRIAVSHHGRTTLLDGLDQLQGLVQIRGREAALRFVRLRTAPSTFHLWPAPAELEVISDSQASRLPGFGLVDQQCHSPTLSGFCGILSDHAYRVGGFTAPRVIRTTGGFLVTRWKLFSMRPLDRECARILLIQEFVGKDGQYKRTVLKEMGPPELPQTIWHFPGFK